jgi:hypothetical protein
MKMKPSNLRMTPDFERNCTLTIILVKQRPNGLWGTMTDRDPFARLYRRVTFEVLESYGLAVRKKASQR